MDKNISSHIVSKQNKNLHLYYPNEDIFWAHSFFATTNLLSARRKKPQKGQKVN